LDLSDDISSYVIEAARHSERPPAAKRTDREESHTTWHTSFRK